MVSFSLPADSLVRAAQMGRRLRLARLRRNWSAAFLAEKAGVSRTTLAAMEAGKPGTAIGIYLAVLWALGLEKTLDAVADPDTDAHGKALEAMRRPRRGGKPAAQDDYDF